MARANSAKNDPCLKCERRLRCSEIERIACHLKHMYEAELIRRRALEEMLRTYVRIE